MQKLFIKNMVCQRCISAVQTELTKQGLEYLHVQLGEAIIKDVLTAEKTQCLAEALRRMGFELLDDQKQQLITKIKSIIINLIHHSDKPEKHKLSEVLTNNLHKDYSYLSSLFSEVEGVTIEKYLISQRIEKVKEMLIYDELTLSEIAYKNGYSSVAHLSAQFKKVTGLTPKHFKMSGINQRRALDQI